MRSVSAALAFAAVAGMTLSAQAADVRIHAKDALDEPFHYCLDLAGGPNNPDLTRPIGAHACKTGDFSDQVFESADVQAGRLRLPIYGRCLQASATAADVAVCSAEPAQGWKIDGEGRIHPAASAGLCLTLDAGPGRVAGSPPGVTYHVRALTLEACTAEMTARQAWTVEAPAVPNKHTPPAAG